jgi:hypothetical protein
MSSEQGRAVTKADLEAFEDDLVADIRRTARSLTLSLTTIVAVLNGIVFTALKLT